MLEVCLVTLALSQTHYTLSVWEHVKDAANTVEVTIPWECSEFDGLKVGQNILDSRLRVGSLVIRGSIGTWNLTVKSKRREKKT